MAKRWTKSEEDYLCDNWGNKNIPQIANYLNRSETAVLIKLKRLNLGAFKDSGEYLCARQISKILRVDVHTVTDWWMKKRGLPCEMIAPRGGKTFHFCKLTDLIKWLKENQNLWDSRRVNFYTLGTEPEWLRQKRQADKAAPLSYKKYTIHEIATISRMFRKGYTKAAIAKEVNRTESAIEHKIMRLGKKVWI